MASSSELCGSGDRTTPFPSVKERTDCGVGLGEAGGWEAGIMGLAFTVRRMRWNLSMAERSCSVNRLGAETWDASASRDRLWSEAGRISISRAQPNLRPDLARPSVALCPMRSRRRNLPAVNGPRSSFGCGTTPDRLSVLG